MTADLTAVVLNWGTAELALAARASLLADGVPGDRVLLVDNGSDGDGIDRLTGVGGPVLRLGENLGFARANNRAAAALPASACYLFVNADASVHRPGSVASLRDTVARPGVDIAVPRLRNPDLTLQRNVVPAATPAAEIVRASGLSRWVPDRWQPLVGTHWDHGSSRTIRAADGPVLAVDARAFDAVGGFSELTFMYGEDHDLFARIARRGGAGWFCADAEFVHVGGAASTLRWEPPERARRVAHARAALLLAGETSATAAHVALAAMCAGALVRAVVAGARGDRASASLQAATWRGCRMAVDERARRSRRSTLK